uniref:Uncharacterized protein n=1 Tax=Rhizophora mucronata TaxID=61149 RepID=A0A2P2M3V1_RHIMU
MISKGALDVLERYNLSYYIFFFFNFESNSCGMWAFLLGFVLVAQKFYDSCFFVAYRCRLFDNVVNRHFHFKDAAISRANLWSLCFCFD